MSTRAQQSDRLVAREHIEKLPQRRATRGGEAWIAAEHEHGILPRRLEKHAVHLDAGDVEAGHAALPRAEHVAFATQFQILLGDAEAIIGLAQDRKPRLGRFAERRLVEEEAGRALGAAADAAAQLMELREAEAFGMLDHHHARLGHVDADFDHGGRDQDASRAGGKARHGAVLFRAAHAAVDEFGAVAEPLLQVAVALLGGGHVDNLGFFDERAHPV